MNTILIVALVFALLFFLGLALFIGVVIWFGREKSVKADHAKTDTHKKGWSKWHLLWIIPVALLFLLPGMAHLFRMANPPPPKPTSWDEVTWSFYIEDKEGFLVKRTAGGDYVQIIEMSDVHLVIRFRADNDWYYFNQRFDSNEPGIFYQEGKRNLPLKTFHVLMGKYNPFSMKSFECIFDPQDDSREHKIVFSPTGDFLDNTWFRVKPRP